MNKDEKNKIVEQENEEKVTITPTMIDESEIREEKRVDLSAIIPKFEDSSEGENKVELSSKENTLKSDGSSLIAIIDGDGQARITPNAYIPNQIDIEERKKSSQKKKNGKHKKEKVKKNNKESQKFQNHMSIVSLCIIAFLGGFYLWYKYYPTEKDFKPILVTVEIGESFPIRTSSYVKPGVGYDVDELLYSIDLSEVVAETPGDYNFYVTYKGIKKTGTVSIVDTTPPILEVRDVTIIEGSNYDASNFVESCKDNSGGCNVSFLDVDTPNKYNTSGVYVVHIVATDSFDNPTTKTANLIIEAQGDNVKYIKKTNFDFNTGYETSEIYDLRFNGDVLIKGTHQKIFYYQSEEKYTEARKIYSGETNYTLDDSKKTITFIETVSTVGSNYSNLSLINDYLIREGYSKE